MKRILAITAITMLWLAAPRPAFADPDEATMKQAEDYYNKGDTAYNLGKFDEAVDWFTKAYETWAVPDFLYNIAQAHRQAGHCKDALYFYQRYKSLKEKDKKAPLSKKDKADLEKFIKVTTDCAAQAQDTASTKPDGTKPPDNTTPDNTTTNPDNTTTNPTNTTTNPTTTTTTTTNPTTTTTNPTTTTTTTTAANDDTDTDTDTDSDQLTVVKKTPAAPKVLSVRAEGGIAKLGAGSINTGVVASFDLGAGYPLAVGPMVLDLGAGVSFSPVSYVYDTMGSSKQGSLIGARAVVGATYPVNANVGVRGELGVGLAMLGGLVQGNPFMADRSAGSLSMLSVRAGVAADYAFTPNVIATFSPAFAFSPAGSKAYMSSLTEIDVLLGLGYRM